MAKLKSKRRITVKQRAKNKKLEARIKAWESIPKSIQIGYTRPGSQKK